MTPFSLIDQLIQQGVRSFCLAPGSRSTPLVQAAASHPKAKIHVHFDERGLGFFALGLAKAEQNPVALIVTSGTAVGNLTPSVMEASHSYTPLILLTADRPQELRDTGANQTTDQIKIFQSFVRWQVDLQPDLDEQTVRSIAAQAFFYSKKNPPGPVQINCPFKEPLYQPQFPMKMGKALQLHFASSYSKPFKTPCSKGVILIGRLPNPDDVLSVLELAKRLNWPVCADILSNARLYPTAQQIRYFDWIEKPTPEIVLHFGERMTSKKILQWLSNLKCEIIHISPYPELQDPERILTGRAQSEIPEFCLEFEAPSDPTWFHKWPQIEKSDELMGFISEILPENFGVFLGNSMPIRDADHFLFPKKCAGFFANRGLSGIDGNIATLAGLAEARPMLGIIGDQTALYDLNSLPLLKKTKYPAILLILNNFGGRIFHHLPVSESPDLAKYWVAEHSFTFEKIASMFEIPYSTSDFELTSSCMIELQTCLSLKS